MQIFKYLCFFISTFIILGCATTQNQRFYALDYKESQNFIIDPHEDSYILGNEGTRIYILKDSFPNATNKVRIILKEYYKLSDIIMSGLTTQTSYGALSTSGMIFVDFVDNDSGKELLINKPYNLSFPNVSYNDESELYLGDVSANKIIWKPIKDSVRKIEKIKMNQEISLINNHVLYEQLVFNTNDTSIKENYWNVEDAMGPIYKTFELKSYGWINCDRLFVSKMTVNVKLKNNEGFPVELLVIFPARKVVLGVTVSENNTIEYKLGKDEEIVFLAVKNLYKSNLKDKYLYVSKIRQDILDKDKEYEFDVNRKVLDESLKNELMVAVKED